MFYKKVINLIPKLSYVGRCSFIKMSTTTQSPVFDDVMEKIADYVLNYDVSQSKLAMNTARICLSDSLSCAFQSLDHTECTKLLGPLVPGAQMSNGCRVPGTKYKLDPVQATFNIGTMVRWLDFNDCWLAAEWGHPSDNFAGILAVADYMTRSNQHSFTMKTVLESAIKAYEIQGVIALENSFNRIGLDHVLLVRIASTAVSTWLLGGERQQILNAISNAWIDCGALRTYRHFPNTGSRKSWAAGDAAARGVRLALMAIKGEMGYPSAITAPKWGFQDVLLNGNSLKLSSNYGSYVMEYILFKVSYPAEFHAQTAVEAAVQLHPQVKDMIQEIDKILIETQESAIRIIDKTGPLNNPADRDHCLQYMTAVPLLKGTLTAEDYSDQSAKDPNIDFLTSKMIVVENERFTREYLEPDKRSIGNSVQVFFNDGTATEKVTIDYPIGHKFRREEAMPLLQEKFEANLKKHLNSTQCKKLFEICENQETLESMGVDQFMKLLVPN